MAHARARARGGEREREREAIDTSENRKQDFQYCQLTIFLPINLKNLD